jgi:hypothetical protein
MAQERTVVFALSLASCAQLLHYAPRFLEVGNGQ